MSQKVEFTQEMQLHLTTIAQSIQALDELEDAYFARGYNSGGLDPITNDDITSTGIDATQVGSMITLSQQLKNLRDNGTVTPSDYRSTFNVVRTDW